MFARSDRCGRYTDRELACQYFSRGEPWVIDVLFRRHAVRVYGWCLAYLKRPADGEDATMEIFEQLIVLLRRHRIEHFTSWLYSISRHHCLKRLRDDRQRRDTHQQWQEHISCDPAPEQQQLLLEQGLQQLSQAQRECLNRFFFYGHSYQQIAQDLITHPKAVKSHLQNGKRNLRNYILRNTGILMDD